MSVEEALLIPEPITRTLFGKEWTFLGDGQGFAGWLAGDAESAVRQPSMHNADELLLILVDPAERAPLAVALEEAPGTLTAWRVAMNVWQNAVLHDVVDTLADHWGKAELARTEAIKKALEARLPKAERSVSSPDDGST